MSVDRTACRAPSACRATGRGLCRGCAKAAGKYSAARKAAWADPAVRARMSAGLKAALADPAVRARISAGLKAAAWQPPAEAADLYADLKPKLGAKEARRLVEAHMAKVARRRPPAAHAEAAE